MRESVIDILCYLFDDVLPEQAGELPNLAEMTGYLQAAGFEREDIGRAIEWFYAFGELKGPAILSKSSSLRVFSTQEKAYLNADCQNFLYGLLRLGLINASLMEVIIERALALEEPLDIETLRWVALMVTMNAQEELSATQNACLEQWLVADEVGTLQ